MVLLSTTPKHLIMRNFILFLMFLTSFEALSQTTASPGFYKHRHYFWRQAAPLKKCDFNGTATNAAPVLIPSTTKFSVVNETQEAYVIQVAKFTAGDENAKSSNKKFVADDSGNSFFFLLPKTLYTSTAASVKQMGSWIFNVATTLVKMRPGKKEPKDNYKIYTEINNDINIGGNFGYRFADAINEKSFSVVAGFAFSSIKVTPYSSKEFLKSDEMVGCGTLSLGAIFEVEKFQVCLFSGIDIMPGEVGRNWIYRDRPWIGIGFGYQLVRTNAEGKN